MTTQPASGRLAGKVGLITGGAGGIGRAAAQLFVAEGARVLLVDRDEGTLRDAVAEVGGGSAGFCVADITQPEDVERCVRTAVERFGGVDLALANAGIEGVVQPLADYPLEVFDQVLAVNVRGVFLTLKYAIPALRERGGGSIIITSSTAGIHGSPGVSAYVTSKHAVIGLMRTAALEVARYRIRVNTVNPAPVDTRMMRSLEQGRVALARNPTTVEQTQAAIAAGIPLRRYGLPEEVARLMLFLASDDSSFCTGGVYMVDGGVSAGS